YEGTVQLAAPGYATITVPVTLQVTPGAVIDVLPKSINFSYQQNAPPPSPQTALVFSEPSGLPFTVEAAVGVLHPKIIGAGVTPGAFSLSVDPTSLPPGRYSSSVQVVSPDATNSPRTISVTLTVTTAPVISATPASLSFTATQFNQPPPAQSVGISSSGPA